MSLVGALLETAASQKDNCALMLSVLTWAKYGGRMGYAGDRQMHCSKEGKKTKHVKCSKCNGKGGGATTQCSHCQNSGYKCENGVNDRWHS